MEYFSLIFLSVFIGLNSPITAETVDASTGIITMPEVLVSADIADEKASLTVADFKTRQQELAQRVGAVEVINADSYKTGRSSTIKDALAFAPGVYVQPRFGQEEARVSIRGSGLQRGICGGRGITILQDGMPINGGDGSFNMQSIEPLATRYMEVYRGANALQYGSTTLGGAINFVEFTGYDAAPFTSRFDYGSYDTFRGQISSGMVLGKYDYYESVTTGFTNGYRDHSSQSNWRLFCNMGYKILEDLETRLYFTYVKTLSQLPGGITKSQLESDPTQANSFNQLNDWQKNYDFLRVADKTTWEHGDNRLEAQFYWDNINLYDAMSVLTEDLNNDLGCSLQWKNKTPLLAHESHFTLGFNPTYSFTRDLQYGNTLGQPSGENANNEQYALNLNLFLQEQFYLTEKLSTVAGTSVTYARRQNVDRWSSLTTPSSEMMTMMPGMACCTSGPGTLDNSGTISYWGWTPQVGLLYDLTKRSQVFANVSRSFAPPSFSELVNANYVGIRSLKAQTATTLEMGTRGREGRYRWDLAYYYSWVENELFPYSVSTSTGPSTLTANAGTTIHQGVEMGFDVTLLEGMLCHPLDKEAESKDFPENGLDRIYLKQVGLFNDFHFFNDSTYGNNPLPGIPMFYYRAELLYEHPSGFYAGPNVEWVPMQYNVDAAATLFADPFALLGFKIGYRPKYGWSVYLQAMNLCNTTYAATTGIIPNAQAPGANLSQFFPGDGISFYGGVEFTW